MSVRAEQSLRERLFGNLYVGTQGELSSVFEDNPR
jgi:hypothetical protein